MMAISALADQACIFESAGQYLYELDLGKSNFSFCNRSIDKNKTFTANKYRYRGLWLDAFCSFLEIRGMFSLLR